jgi:RNA polymerase sigma-70 factor, ECF subfamily
MTGEVTLNLPIFGTLTEEKIAGSNLPQLYEENQQHVYTLAFWMTDNELEAEELMKDCFHRAFSSAEPSAETIDRALVSELRATKRLGALTLKCVAATRKQSVRRNARRVDLERAVVQLPGTERMIYLLHDAERYSETRIAYLLSLSEDEVRIGLHQARLRMRELLARA